MINKGLLSSKRSDWKTPKSLFIALHRKFHFNFDPCPSKSNFNGLEIEWGKHSFLNPPYGTQIKYWIKKAWEEAQKGETIVLLVPSRTDTQYWHEYVMKAHEIWFIKGRLKFDDHYNSASFPSAIIIFNGKKEEASFPKLKSVDIHAQNL